MDESLVYSTLRGKTCPCCENSVAQCVCSKKQPIFKDGGLVRVSRETKGRKGKCVTLICGLHRSGNELTELARQFKQRCGSGGTVKENVIEIQGDHRDTLVNELNKLGYNAKKVGG
jgi:translation initiation factor 1